MRLQAADVCVSVQGGRLAAGGAREVQAKVEWGEARGGCACAAVANKAKAREQPQLACPLQATRPT